MTWGEVWRRDWLWIVLPFALIAAFYLITWLLA